MARDVTEILAAVLSAGGEVLPKADGGILVRRGRELPEDLRQELRTRKAEVWLEAVRSMPADRFEASDLVVDLTLPGLDESVILAGSQAKPVGEAVTYRIVEIKKAGAMRSEAGAMRPLSEPGEKKLSEAGAMRPFPVAVHLVKKVFGGTIESWETRPEDASKKKT